MFSSKNYYILFILMFNIFLFGFSQKVYAFPQDEEEEIEIDPEEIEQTDKKKQEHKNSKEEDFDPNDKSDEDLSDEDLEKELESGVNDTKAEQQTEKETPLETSNYDVDLDKALGRTKTNIPFYLELNIGPSIGFLDLHSHYGASIHINFMMRLAKYYALGVSGGFLFSGSPSGKTKTGLGISLQNRIIFPILKVKHKSLIEGFIDFKTGFITREAEYKDSDFTFSGINLLLSLGIAKRLNKNLSWTFETSYAFPYWLQECSDYSGAYHCNSADFKGHDLRLNFGVMLIF